MQIIESISKKKGIITTGPGPYLLSRRFQNPQPGDVIDLRHISDRYPYSSANYGRVYRVGPDGWAKEGEIHICYDDNASVFLNEDGSVSISGGPFGSVEKAQLEPTLELMRVRFWNWGNNVPGAHMGVDYRIDRPVFSLVIK